MRQKCCQPKTLTLDPKTGVGSVQDLLVEKKAPTPNQEKNNFTQSTSKGQGADLKVSEAGTEKTDQAQRVLSIVPFKDGPSNQPT